MIECVKNKTFLLLFFISTALFFTSYTQNNDEKIKQDIQQQVENYYLSSLNGFYFQIENFRQLVNSNAGDSVLIQQFLFVHREFKRIEFIVGYDEVMGDEVSREYRWINGPNIITDEYDSLSSQPVYPHGLQTIEEILFNDEIDFKTLLEETNFLAERIAYKIERHKNTKAMSSQEFHIFIWDAMRYGLIRLSSLGITGFDVPFSQQINSGITVSLNSMEEVASMYEPLFKKHRAQKLLKEGLAHFNRSIYFTLHQEDFDSFDRVTFLKVHIKQLSDWMHQSISVLNFNFPIETRAVTNKTAYIFDKDFFNIPFYISQPTKEKMELGKKLFFDKNLSGNKTRNCATCHIQEKGLADGMVKNISLKENEFLKRNTPSLWNIAFQSKFFYDARVQRLELQILDVLQSEDEMQGDIKNILLYVKNDENYVQLFDKAYNGMVNEWTLTNALADYLKSYVSLNSRFDQYMRGEAHALLSEDEKAGFNLFMGKAKCGTCHFAPIFNGLIPPKFKNTESEIIGVPISKDQPSVLDNDLGRYLFTRLSIHRNAFKTPGIRNIGLTAPYMHNGVFESLEEVMDFYNHGGGVGHGIELPHQTLPSDSLNLSRKEIQQIIAFMHSLQDTVRVDLFSH